MTEVDFSTLKRYFFLEMLHEGGSNINSNGKSLVFGTIFMFKSRVNDSSVISGGFEPRHDSSGHLDL